MKRLEVVLSPALYPYYESDNSIVVIIDILRATTAICTAFEYGASAIIPVATVEEALKYKERGYLTGAERNGEKLEGFDFGNSPFDYMTEKIKGKEIVLTTTNGTQAIEMAKNAESIVIGAFTNMTALKNWILAKNKNVLLLCSGWKNKFNLEDSLFAGAMIHELYYSGLYHDVSDSALSCMYLYQMAFKDPYRFLSHSSHKRRLAQLGLKNDIKYALTPDQTNKIPVYSSGKITVA